MPNGLEFHPDILSDSPESYLASDDMRFLG